MGLYVKRRKSMYSVCAMDDDFPRSGNFIVVVVFNMLGDSLRDILDPKDE